jgi:hypothetical protein
VKDFSSLISIENKTGFVDKTNPFVAIYDINGKPFYIHDTKNKPFNIPKGVYFTNNRLTVLPKPVKYLTLKLPTRERIRPKKKLTYNFQPFNPNKAQINTLTGDVYIDKNFWDNLTLPEKCFLIAHEKGHFLYTTETFCDLYAAKKMIKEGFNPSQIAKAINSTLSQLNNRYRLNNVLRKFFKSNGQ